MTAGIRWPDTQSMRGNFACPEWHLVKGVARALLRGPVQATAARIISMPESWEPIEPIADGDRSPPCARRNPPDRSPPSQRARHGAQEGRLSEETLPVPICSLFAASACQRRPHNPRRCPFSKCPSRLSLSTHFSFQRTACVPRRNWRGAARRARHAHHSGAAPSAHSTRKSRSATKPRSCRIPAAAC